MSFKRKSITFQFKEDPFVESAQVINKVYQEAFCYTDFYTPSLRKNVRL